MSFYGLSPRHFFSLLALASLLLLPFAGTAHAFTAGPSDATTVGGCSWSGLGGDCSPALGSSNSQCAISGGGGQFIELTGFGFNLPDSVTSIDGITVDVDLAQQNGCSSTVALLDAGSVVGDSRTVRGPTSLLCTGSDVDTAGGPTDTWGNSWTAAAINDADFGLRLTTCAITALDSVQVTVDFTIADDVCGDGFITGIEACDDSNATGGDNCSARCQTEATLSKDEIKCVTGANKAGIGVAKAYTGLALGCIKNASKGRIESALDCIDTDAKGKITKAAGKVDSNDSNSCNPEPPFGYAGSTAVTEGATTTSSALLRDLFGDDLDAAIVLASDDKDSAKCQAALASGVMKSMMGARSKLFEKCKKGGLAGKKVATMVSAADMDACFAAIQADEKGKIRKALGGIEKALGKTCVDVSVPALIPGFCSEVDANELLDCLTSVADCRTCQWFDAMDNLGVNCDLIDDNTINGSCLPPE